MKVNREYVFYSLTLFILLNARAGAPHFVNEKEWTFFSPLFSYSNNRLSKIDFF